MKHRSRFSLRPLVRFPVVIAACCALALAGCGRRGGDAADWEGVWRAVAASSRTAQVPEPGPPVALDGRVWFRFRPSTKPVRVFLAGNFNAWAQNDAGRVSNMRFAMHVSGDGVWTLSVPHDRDTFAYQFVVEESGGGFAWMPDPSVGAGNTDGHSIVTLPRPRPSSLDAPVADDGPRQEQTAPLRPLMDRVWVRPGESNLVRVEPPQVPGPAATWRLRVEDAAGRVFQQADFPARRGDNTLPVGAMDREGGYRVVIRYEEPGQPAREGWAVHTVANSIADDLRYGFFASYANHSGGYERRAEMLADLAVNAVEFYDFFPAHGRYAPIQETYRFEPFGIAIDARDVRDKAAASRRRNILPIAYVAAYAASESVYREHPHPMTDAAGTPLVFNGEIMTASRADREGRPKWFYLMNIAADSPWRTHVLGEFRRLLDDGPGDLVEFDGFEIDTYGDRPEDRFHAPGSAHDGRLRREVLGDFVGQVRNLTREVKPHGLVSFNSVNEFGVGGMYDITDFLFMEIWRFHADRLTQVAEICRYHGAQRNQRVVLKVYPADMEQKAVAFPPRALARLLGACLAGGGTLMVAGEPDPATGRSHALQSLFYPDHQPMDPACEAILRAYNRHDALHFGLTHGRSVHHVALPVALADCHVTAFAAPDRRTLTLRILHYGREPRWTVDPGAMPALRGQTLRFPLPGGVVPVSVRFSSPDSPATAVPAPVPFTVADGTITITLPDLDTLATLSLAY